MSCANIQGTQNVHKCLYACGWQPFEGGGWIHSTTGGDAFIRQTTEAGEWTQFELQTNLLPPPRPTEILAVNGRLFGPLKFVVAGDGSVCRIDLPRHFPSVTRELDFGSDGSGFEMPARQTPLQAWAAAVTIAATGRRPNEQAMIADERLLELVTDAGWSASLDEGQLNVHVQLPGLYGQLYLEPTDRAGGMLAADLLPLDGVDGDRLQAVMCLANAANRRLPLVRLAVSEDTSPRVLRAEVHVGCAPIPDEWVLVALEALEAAVSLVARELKALRDPELATLVLAADAA